MILNGLPWKRTEIILSFLRLHPSTAFQILADHDGYSISSEGFLPTVVDVMVFYPNLPFTLGRLIIPFKMREGNRINNLPHDHIGGKEKAQGFNTGLPLLLSHRYSHVWLSATP